MNVEQDIERVKREPGEGEDNDNGDKQRVRSRLLLNFFPKTIVLLDACNFVTPNVFFVDAGSRGSVRKPAKMIHEYSDGLTIIRT